MFAEATIAVVEDDEDIRALIEFTLSTQGFVVTAVDSGLAGVDAVRETNPDLVTLDLGLPGIDGIEATRRIVTDSGPVVFLLSTYDEDQIDASGCGAAAYVPKAAFGPQRLADEWRDAVGVSADG